MSSYFILIFAGLLAGGLNAIAGGGTFISFPALVWLGIPPISANATATLTALPGYCTSAWSFKTHILSEGRASLIRFISISILGGAVGAVLLLSTSNQIFSAIVPYLMLFATLVFTFGQKLIAKISGKTQLGVMAAIIIFFFVSIYGGYFNGGLGIMLLASFSVIGHANIHYMNGMKNLLSAILSIVSASIFIASGLIDWPSALVLGLATAIGGFIGGHFSVKIKNVSYLRVFIMCVGFFLSLAFFLKNY